MIDSNSNNCFVFQYQLIFHRINVTPSTISMPNSPSWRAISSQAFRTFFWLYTDRYKYLANGSRLGLAESLDYGAVFDLVKKLHKLHAWFPSYARRNSMCRFIHKLRYPTSGVESILTMANYSGKWRAIDKLNALKQFVNGIRGEPVLRPVRKIARIADNVETLATTPRRRPSVSFRSSQYRSSRARPTSCRTLSFSANSPKRRIVLPTGVSKSSIHWNAFVKIQRFNFEVIWLWHTNKKYPWPPLWLSFFLKNNNS